MRIVYLHQYYNTPEMSGSTRSYEMARRWAAAGHDVQVVTSTRTEGADAGWRISHREGVTVHWYPVPYNNAMGYAARILAFLRFSLVAGARARRLRGDVIFATSTPLTIFIPAYAAQLGRRTSIVFEVRDLWPQMPIAAGYLNNGVLRWLARALESTAYRRSAQVVALSDGMAEGVCAAGKRRSDVTVAPNSCDLERFAVDVEVGMTYRNSQPWLGRRPLVVYCGTLGQINDVSYLVRLAAAMRKLDGEVAFAIFGSGRDDEVVRRLAVELNVLDVNLYLMGRIAKSEVPAVLSAATVATSLFAPIPDMWVNSANKFFDALAAGRPVAINYGGWQAKVLERTGAGIVLNPMDPAGAAVELLNFINGDARLAAAREAARRLAETEYARDIIAARVLEVVENTADHRPDQERSVTDGATSRTAHSGRSAR